MFTGIIQELGKIQSIKTLRQGLCFEVSCQFPELELGESIAVDGACLTVTSLSSQGFSCDVSPETLNLTIAGKYTVGSGVNLERALRVGDRLGGHWVSGHVDQVIQLAKKEIVQDFWKLTFSGLNAEHSMSLLKKGSIAVNGVSLTLNEVLAESFEVMIIPHTLERTNLKCLEVGHSVNVELDWMSKLVVQTVSRLKEGL